MLLTLPEWNTLLDTPAPPAPKLALGVANREEQRRVDGLMWMAIDEGDLSLLRRALKEGARLTQRRKGRHGAWEALHQNHWDLAAHLVQAGAGLNARTLSGHSLMGAIAHRDDPQQAQALLDLGFDHNDATTTDFFQGKGAPTLLQWWLEQGHPEAFHCKPLKPMDWLRVGARGSPKLRALINEAWGVEDLDPNKFPKYFDRSDPLERFWGEIFQKNDVELVRALLKSGWGFYDNAEYNYCTASWLAAKKGSWEVVEWLCTSDVFKQQMLLDAERDPATSWWPTAVSCSAIERIKQLGVDIEKPDSWGRTIAHHVTSDKQRGGLRKHLALWIMQNHPDLFSAKDKGGKTPKDNVDDQDWAEFNALVLKRSTQKPKEAPSPAVVRRI